MLGILAGVVLLVFIGLLVIAAFLALFAQEKLDEGYF